MFDSTAPSPAAAVAADNEEEEEEDEEDEEEGAAPTPPAPLLRAANCSVLIAERMSPPAALHSAERDVAETCNLSSAHTAFRRCTRRTSVGG